uniref:Putative secreted protein n=1 Tax=Anopheles darlingi TaxID=43151 RepID=A0A2M4DE97_ANODA
MVSISFLLSLAAHPAQPLLLFTALLKATLETIMPHICQSSFYLHYCFLAIGLGMPTMQCSGCIVSIILTKQQQQEYKEHNFIETPVPRGLLVARVLRLQNNDSLREVRHLPFRRDSLLTENKQSRITGSEDETT